MPPKALLGGSRDLRRLPAVRSAVRRNWLFLKNRAIVGWCAKAWPNLCSAVGRERALELGDDALLRAAELWVPEQGAFSTYASYAIRSRWTCELTRRKVDKLVFIGAFREGGKDASERDQGRVGGTLAEPPDPRGGVDDEVERWDREERVRGLLDKLPSACSYVLHAYYLRGLTMRKIGRHLGISRERVRQVLHKAVELARRVG